MKGKRHGLSGQLFQRSRPENLYPRWIRLGVARRGGIRRPFSVDHGGRLGCECSVYCQAVAELAVREGPDGPSLTAQALFSARTQMGWAGPRHSLVGTRLARAGPLGDAGHKLRAR